ncbi:MAG: ATP-dependent helicase RecG, partial [Oscillospiraceae bacterium]|nr:ATP-dependent helicase RecG [Oscillospiraceae bacterium]
SALELIKDDLFDPLPGEITERYGLCHIGYALQNIHFPKDKNALEIAKKRLVFEELLTLQLGLLKLRSRNRKSSSVMILDKDISAFLEALPYELTSAQKRAIDEALSDMKEQTPMNRLVQGDVGSGKTMIAAALCYACTKNGFQTALMAPTEILAEQHFHTLNKILSPLGIRICLLTGSLTPKQKTLLKSDIAEGQYDLVIGTHALVQDSTVFHSLGLVVTDEQHRFGVEQRSRLAQKGDNPHILIMSATPIPRTLALIIYGDLDVSVVDEMPIGRKPIETYCIDSRKRARAFGFIKEHIDEGRQAYIVCPLIEDTESELNAVTTYAQKLSKEDFVGYSVGLLHGRLKAQQKEQIMRDFSDNKISLLVSTTVIEVGVDVPNAVIMLIENAERFGLSQLHQLRGRVGRGEHQSYCILVSDHKGDETATRLKVMCKTSDGFKISEEDLKLRGPGDFFGERQHGLPALKIANMAENMEVLKHTQNLAKEIMSEDAELFLPKNKGLYTLVSELFGQAFSGGFN